MFQVGDRALPVSVTFVGDVPGQDDPHISVCVPCPSYQEAPMWYSMTVEAAEQTIKNLQKAVASVKGTAGI